MPRKKNEAAKVEQIAPAPESPAQEAQPQTMRVRILRPIRSKAGNYAPGQSVTLPAVTARSWIGFGLAEQDKTLDGPPEKK